MASDSDDDLDDELSMYLAAVEPVPQAKPACGVEIEKTEQKENNGTEVKVGNAMSYDASIQKLSLLKKEENDSYDVTDGCVSSDSNHSFVCRQNAAVTADSQRNENSGKTDNKVESEMDNKSKKDSEFSPVSTYNTENNETLDVIVKSEMGNKIEINKNNKDSEVLPANTQENEDKRQLDVSKSAMDNNIEINKNEKDSEIFPGNTYETENDERLDVQVMSELDNNSEVNTSSRESEQNNEVTLEIDTCSISDSEDELSLYLSAENMNKKDNNEIKLDNAISIGNVKNVEVQTSLDHANDEKNPVDHVKLKSVVEKSVGNINKEIETSLGQINEVKNIFTCETVADAFGKETYTLDENMPDKTVVGKIENNAIDLQETSQPGTEIDEIFVSEEQNNNDSGVQSDVISVDDNTDVTDDELSMYLTHSESKQAYPVDEKRKAVIILHDQKKVPQRTDIPALCSFQHQHEPVFTRKVTDCNKNITDELDSTHSQLMQTEESVDLKCAPSLNTNHSVQQEVIETQNVYPETHFMPEAAKVLDSSVRLRPSSTVVDKPSPIKQKDVRTLEKMLHYSAKGFSDQIIIQSPTKGKSEPHLTDTGLKRGNSLVEITIFNADETRSHEKIKDSVLAASSSVEKASVGPVVKGIQGSCEEKSKIVSKEIIVLGQNAVPSMFDENVTRQKSDFSTVTNEFLDSIKKQGNENQQVKKHSIVIHDREETKPSSVKNKVITSAVNKTNKKSKHFDSYKHPKQKASNEQEPKSVRPQVGSGKFFRKDNKLYIVTNVDGKMVEKEFVRSQKEADVKLVDTVKTETELKAKAQKYVEKPIENNTGNNNGTLIRISENTVKADTFSDKRSEILQPAQAARARIEGTFLEKSKNVKGKLQSKVKDTCKQSGIQTSSVVNSHDGPPVGFNKQGALLSSVIDLTRHSKGVKLKNEIDNSEKASCGSVLQSSQSEKPVVSQNSGSSYNDNNGVVRETNGQEISNLSENKLKDEKKKFVVMSPQILDDQNGVHFNHEATDNAKHSKEVQNELMIHSEGEENANIESEKDLDNKDRNKQKETATIRVFRVEQSPKKRGKQMAKFIILQDDGRYHELDNVEIDVETEACTSSLTSVPFERDSKSAALEFGTRSRKDGIINGSLTETQIHSKEKGSASAVNDAAVQSDICRCTCSCKCKAVMPSSLTKGKQAVQTESTGERLEDSEALAKVKRKLRLNDEVSNFVETASADISVSCAMKKVNLIDISFEEIKEDTVLLKLRKQVELMRLIGKNKKKAGCILAHRPLKRRKQTAEISKEGKKLNQQANILPKETDVSADSRFESKSEQHGPCSELEIKNDNKDIEYSISFDVQKKGVKRKSRETCSPKEQHLESLTDTKQTSTIKSKTELTTNVPKQAKLKTDFPAGCGRELKKLKIDMRQEIFDYTEKLNESLTENNSVQTRFRRRKVKSPETRSVEKEISRTACDKVSDTCPEQSEVKGNKNSRGACKQIKKKVESVDSDLENTTILDRTESNKNSSEKKEESKKHKSTCKRELDNLFIDMVVGNKIAKSQSDSDYSDTQATTGSKRKLQYEGHEEARVNKQKSTSPKRKSSQSEKRSLGESFSPIKKGKLIISDDFIPDISNAMEECLRLIKEKEKVLEEVNVGGNIAEIKQEKFEKHDKGLDKTESEINMNYETGIITKCKPKDNVPGGFEIERQLCENCGKFVTVYITKTGLLCYVSEKQLVNIDDNEQQLCEACGSFADSGSVKAHYVLQEKNLTIDESYKRKDFNKQAQTTSKIDCDMDPNESPKGKSRKIKQNKEKSLKNLKVRFTEPKRSPKKDRSPKRRKIKESSENNTEVKKKRKKVVKESQAMTKIKDKKHINVKTDSNLETSISFSPPCFKESESIPPISLKYETIDNVDTHEFDLKITDRKSRELQKDVNSEDKRPNVGNKLGKIKGMKTLAGRQLKRSGGLKHSRKSRLKHSPWQWGNRYPRQFKRFQKYEWKKLLKEDVTFDFHNIVKEEEKPNIKHLEKLMHEVLGKTKDPEHKKKKKHRTEKKKDKETINMPETLTSPLERPRNFQRYEFSPTGHISSSETETDIEGPFLSMPSNISNNVTDIQYVSEHQANTSDFVSHVDSSVLKEFIAVKVDDISQHDDEIQLVDDVPVTIL